MNAMRSSPSFSAALRKVDRARIAAIALVLCAHVALALLVHEALQPAQGHGDEAADPESVLTVEFIASAAPAPARTAFATVTLPAESARSPQKSAPQRDSTTSVEFLEDSPQVNQGPAPPATNAADVFDPAPVHKPFPQSPSLASNLPRSTIRLPDRPSMLQQYWAVPEGENLQGRAARKVPLVGLLLAAIGANGQPRCPPKSEHPDCLRLLIDSAAP